MAYTVEEGRGEVVLSVRREGESEGDVSVTFNTRDESALGNIGEPVASRTTVFLVCPYYSRNICSEGVLIIQGISAVRVSLLFKENLKLVSLLCKEYLQLRCPYYSRNICN